MELGILLLGCLDLKLELEVMQEILLVLDL